MTAEAGAAADGARPQPTNGDIPDRPRLRPLVAIGYGPRCVPAMQLAEAAAGVCDLLWIIDGSLAEMAQMTPLLRRFGCVVERTGIDVNSFHQQVAAHRPDGLVTYLDAGMVQLAQLAESL